MARPLRVDCAEITNIEGDPGVLIGVKPGDDGLATGIAAVLLSPDGSMGWYSDYGEGAQEHCTTDGKVPAALRRPILDAYLDFLRAEAARIELLRVKARGKGKRP